MKTLKRLSLGIVVFFVVLIVSTMLGAPLITSGAIAADSPLQAVTNSLSVNAALASTSTLVIAAKDSPDKKLANYVCDGKKDEVEINAAISALPAGGGKITLLEGTFYCSSKIGLRPNLPYTIEGQGSTTLLTFDSTATKSPLFYNHYNGNWANLKNVTLANFKIVDTHAKSQTYGVLISWEPGQGSHTNITVDGLETVGCGIWVANVTSGEAIIKNCYVHDIPTTNDRAIGICRSIKGSIFNNTIETVNEMGITGIGDATLEVYDNSLTATGLGGKGYAIDVSNSTNVDIYSNTIGASLHGILSENSEGNINVHDNLVNGTSNNKGYGIQVWRLAAKYPKAKNITITGNHVSAFKFGISLNDVDTAVVSLNEVNNIGQSAITVAANADWGSSPKSVQIINNNLFDFSHIAWQSGVVVVRADHVDIMDNNIDGNNNAKSRGIQFVAKSAPNCTILRNNIVNVTYEFTDVPKDTTLVRFAQPAAGL